VAPGWLGRVQDETWRPRGLTAYLRTEAAALKGLRMYNIWGWGGFLGWELGPDYKVFQDGRYLFHAFLPAVQEAQRTPESWQAFLDGQGVDLVLVENRPQWAVVEREGERITRKLDVFFLPRTDWAPVYWDRQAMAFVRRKAAPGDWLKTRGYRWLDPSDLDRLAQEFRKKRFAPQLLDAELERYARNGGDPLEAERLRAWWAATQARAR